MTSVESDIWRKLEHSRPQGLSLAARPVAPGACDRLLAAVDADGRRHFLIRIASGDIQISDKQSRGVQVETREMVVSGGEAARYIDIACMDPVGHEVFQLIGRELVDGLQENPDSAATIKRVLAKWRRFWGQLPREILSRECQIGLFAELWFLNHWMVPSVGAGESVHRWRGPFRSRHDFEWQLTSVEVKATTSVRGVRHRINGIDQLVCPDGGALFLFSLRLREESGAVHSLPSLIEECRHALEIDDDALGGFESRLLQAGYSPVHSDEYSKLHLRVVDEVLYAVREGFPMLVPSGLINGVPLGVEYIGYDIDLSGFNHLRVGRELLFRKEE